MSRLQAQPQALPGYATSPNPAYNQQTLPPRLLHVYHQGLSHRHTQILDSDKRTPLYRIDANSAGLFSSKPHMKVYAAATNAEVATITFHSFSSDIDLTVHNQPIVLTKSGFFTSAHEFSSLATGGVFKWKNDGVFSGGDMLCLDQREQLIARFESSNWAMKKEGKFELSPGVSGVLMDEIVASGIAMVEQRRRQKKNSAAASASAGSG